MSKRLSKPWVISLLKEFEKGKLVTRKEYPQIPSKVEYRLSVKKKSLIPR